MTKITSVTGNILDSEANAIINPVNCVGIMGKGLALQFKTRFPENFRIYKKFCDEGKLKPGIILSVRCKVHEKEFLIMNFPTKRHWKDKSKIEDIEAGLGTLIKSIHDFNITSIAIPPLGCGLGGLEWAEVRSLLEKTFLSLDCNIEVFLYEQRGGR